MLSIFAMQGIHH